MIGLGNNLEGERASRNCAADLVLKYVNSLEGQGDEFIQTGDRLCAESSGKKRAHEVGNNAKVDLSLVMRKETRQVD